MTGQTRLYVKVLWDDLKAAGPMKYKPWNLKVVSRGN